MTRVLHLPATEEQPGRSVTLYAPALSVVPAFPARVVDVHDGDTIRVDITLNYGVQLAGRRVRFAGCNAAEVSTPAGVAARDHLRAILPTGTAVTIGLVSLDADPHGRPLVTVALADGTDLVEQLIADEWAAPWDGRGPAPVPAWPRIDS